MKKHSHPLHISCREEKEGPKALFCFVDFSCYVGDDLLHILTLRGSTMRLYTFTNYYLSDIQRGIQSAHLVHELFIKYSNAAAEPLSMLYDWAENHKTMVVLNGGNSQSLSEIQEKLIGVCGTTLPFASFNEDEQSLNGALTCVGVVVIEYNDVMRKLLPEDANDVAKMLGLTDSEWMLADLIKRYPLA